MKQVMLICAPVTSRSGYGAHARDLTRAFIKHDKYDIKIIDVPWGDCPRNALDVNNHDDRKISDCILQEPKLDSQPDIYVDIRIPNEFQQWGKFNIGITAGIETTAVSQAWIEGCNKMDLIIVPSEHSKKGFIDTLYEKMQPTHDGSQQKVGELKLEKPIEVVFEGVDEDIYKPIENASLDLVDDIKEDFCFLHVGQWTKGGFGEDRKDIAKMIKLFYEAFANKKEQPALILKTSGASFSIIDKEECLSKIGQVKNMFPSDWKLPNVYLLHGSLSDEEMNYLYNHPKVKSMVSFTHGEGFGRPLLEATMVGLPVIVSAWSGHCDFVSTENSLLLAGNLVKVPGSQIWKDIIMEESQWFNINEQQAYKALNYSFKNKDDIKSRADKLMKINRQKFTLDKMTGKLNEIVMKNTSHMSSQVGLKLPKLKKVNSKAELPKIQLPKLKKVTDGVGV
jgi:glycosyltransferase involved in cell wall biosynthesis